MTGIDQQIPGGPVTQNDLRAMYGQFDWTDLKTSAVFTDHVYRDSLINHPTLFDPNAKNAQGEIIDRMSRAGIFAGNVEANIRALNFDRLSLDTIFKNIDRKVGIFEAIIVGILGTAYVKSLTEDEEPLNQLITDGQQALTWENGENLTIGVLGTITIYGAATLFFGPVGFGAVLAFDILSGVRDLSNALEYLEEAFPHAEWLPPIQDAVEVVADTIDNLLPDPITLPTVAIATGELTAHASADVDIAIGFDKAILEGGTSNDLLIQFGSGDVNGGDGRDLIIATGSCEIDGGGGNDIVISFGAASKIDLGAGDDKLMHAGEGSIVNGGAGEDDFWYTDGILIGDASGDDKLSYYGTTLQTAIAWGGADSEWAYFGGLPFVWAGFNGANELVVQDFISLIRQGFNSAIGGSTPDAAYYMYFAGANQNPEAAPSERTAGIRVVELSFEAWQLMEFPVETRTLSENNAMWKFMAEFYKERMPRRTASKSRMSIRWCSISMATGSS
ncbi:MAG: calcium-binding protein [Rhodospirillales bacterium]|nr:calcium-binding protein [Rhodospirillales bacterium]